MLIGTCRNNRKGWPKHLLDLKKNVTRGTFKMTYCRHSQIGAYQWCDSKVVNCVSSYLSFDVGTVKRQVGSTRKQFSCPQALMHYQQNMGGVDKGDQIRGHFGGFASQSHFKKWYKKTLMAVVDCMLLNAYKLWNMSVDRVTGRMKLRRFDFMLAVLHYKTEPLVSPVTSPAAN